MFTYLYKIDGPWPGQLAISARPRGGDWLEDEMRSWRHEGIDVVVSLLTPDEAADLDLAREQDRSEANGIEFHSFPIVDRSVPASDVDVHRFLSKLDVKLSEGKNVTIHCRQGIGRAGLIAASLLVDRGFTPEPAIERVSRARHLPIPETDEQRQWI